MIQAAVMLISLKDLFIQRKKEFYKDTKKTETVASVF